MCDVTSKPAKTALLKRLVGFVGREDGAVTVDWVVLTGAAVGLCMGMFASVNSGLYTVGEGLGTALKDAEVVELGTLNAW